MRRFLSPLGRYRQFIADDLEPAFVDQEIVALGLNSARSLTFGRGRLNPPQIDRAAERYQIAGHSALVVQAGTMSTRQRGEANSFNVLRLNRPHITVERRMWDDGRGDFAEASCRTFSHSADGWTEET